MGSWMKMATQLEEWRPELLAMLDKFPVEIESKGKTPYIRAVIDTEADLDRLIQQLKRTR